MCGECVANVWRMFLTWNWAILSRASHASINMLLSNLRCHFPELPSDARTILRASVIPVKTLEFKNGSFEYYGLFDALKRINKNADLPQNLDTSNSPTRIYFNIDGIPISKSSSNQLWPILGKLDGYCDPFIVGIFRGTGKPSDIQA